MLLVLLCSVLEGVCCIMVKKGTPLHSRFIFSSCKNKSKLLYVAAMSQCLNPSSDDNESNTLREIMKRQSEKVE